LHLHPIASYSVIFLRSKNSSSPRKGAISAWRLTFVTRGLMSPSIEHLSIATHQSPINVGDRGLQSAAGAEGRGVFVKRRVPCLCFWCSVYPMKQKW
jgi:hypothetical protein